MNERRTKLATATADEREAARRDYEHHRAACRIYRIRPKRFDTYLIEWVAVERSKSIEPAARPEADRELRRDYSLMYADKSGFERDRLCETNSEPQRRRE